MAIPLENKHSYETLKSLLENNKDELMKTRVKILLLIKKSFSRKEISGRLSVNIDTITDVVKRYNQNGVSSLKTNKGGRPEGNPIWDAKIFDKLVEEINKQDRYWSIPLMQEWIEPYSPELNPVERYFEEMRRATADRIFTTIDELEKRLTDTINSWSNVMVKNLTCYEWIQEQVGGVS